MVKLFQSPWFISVTSGVLFALSFPTVGTPFLLFPAFCLLFVLAEKADSGKQLAYWSYPAFAIWNLLTTYWLMYATVPGGLAAILANAVIMTIPLAWMRRVLISKMHNGFKVLLIPSIWTTYEYLHFRWDLAWPWLSLGNAFGNYPKLIQFIEFTGQLGITWLVVYFALPLYKSLKNWAEIQKMEIPYWKKLFSTHKTTNQKNTTSPLFILLLIVIFGFLMTYLGKNYKDLSTYPHVEVAVIQPNYDSYLPNAGYTNMNEAQHNLLSLADSARTPQTKIMFFPENSIQPLVSLHSHYVSQFRDSAMKWNLTLVSGLNELVTYKDPSQTPEVYRGLRYNEPYDIFNSSMVWERDGKITPYRKYNLVPLVERFPFVEVLSKLDVFDWIPWGSFAGFGRGYEVVNAPFEGGSSSILICYDSVFPDWNRQYVKQGATLIGLITNDGWWGDTPGHEQHFNFGRLRAIETRRTIARSANNGISGFILPNGEVLKRTRYWERTFVTEQVPLLTEETFYVKYGDWIGWLSLILSFLGFVLIKIKD
ncbi:apolipoprotein N-acyltransferase [bacterium]|nr:MAG: apolipoprotein N-acyltransferase [bacterium]